jgi:phosphoesterase RecJ-like protein
MGENGASADRDRVLEELRSAQQLIVVAHEHPDGDALGSLIGMQGALTALG